MRAFAHLLDRLSFTASRNAKLTLVANFLKETGDPERGWALAALTGELAFREAKPAAIRRAVEARNLQALAEVMVHAALGREESRGAHFRMDFPERAAVARHSVIAHAALRFV